MASTDIHLKNQVFDLIFHPKQNTLYTALLTGEIKAFNYTLGEPDEITYEKAFSVRPTKKSCRGLALDQGGDVLYAVGKDKALNVIDTATGEIISTTNGAHDAPINRIKYLLPSCLVTGDDDGVVKLWDPRIKPAGPTAQKSFTHHWDVITDFLYFDDKKHLLTTSSDATLSVIDIRTSKSVPLSVSESQDDELLSCVSIKNGAKVLTGSSMGILSVWDKTKGYRDCVDRIPGHPDSIETMVPLSEDIVATGSSDGMIRIVSILPTKFMGVIAHHEDYPIERLALSHDSTILGSASHDEVCKLTDIRDIFDDSDEEDGEEEDGGDEGDEDVVMGGENEVDGDEGEEDEEEEKEEPKVIRQPSPEPERRKKKKKELVANREEEERAERGNFFSGL